MKLFLTNQNKAERIIRLITSLFLLPSFFIPAPPWYSTIVGSIGAILFFNALVGTRFSIAFLEPTHARSIETKTAYRNGTPSVRYGWRISESNR
ncbi:DUF2892 domain-containing protein [Flavobacteriales bacterium]|nr:DUF2892 domain-containing protein [Flavobacteriales bacterium]